jgi:arylformamidase
MALYRGMDAAELEAQYNLRARRPDFEQLVATWMERCRAFRAASDVEVDLAYGPAEREKLDLFHAGRRGGPLLVYIHGGYWQRGDKAMYSFVAEPFLRHGVSVAVINYTLTPAVRIGAIAPQVRRAVAWLWHNAGRLEIDRDRICVMGHSAGGHLTAMMMATDWPAHDRALPRDLVKAGVPVSGLFELEPLVHTSINEGPRMDVAEARRESPQFMAPATDAPQLVVVGGAETAEFHRQSDHYAATFRTAQRTMERYDVPDADHFDELNRLAEADSEFFRRSLALVRG